MSEFDVDCLKNLCRRACKKCRQDNWNWFDEVWFFLFNGPIGCLSSKKLKGSSDVFDNWAYHQYPVCPYRMEHMIINNR